MTRFIENSRLKLALVLAAMMAPVTTFAAGSCVFGSSVANPGQGYMLEWVCTAHSDGTVTSPTITNGTIVQGKAYDVAYTGIIGRVQIVPGTSGDQPTDSYDVELRSSTDSTVDFLGGAGDNVSNTNTKTEMPLTETNAGIMQLFNNTLVPYATGCGDANKFTLRITVLP